MNRTLVASTLAIAVLAAASAVPAAAHDAAPCDARSIVVALDPDASGAVLAIRNAGASPCTIARAPRLELRDTSSAVVSTGQPPRLHFVHPGPVMVPVVLIPGALAATTLRWPTATEDPTPGDGGDATSLAVFPGVGVRSVATRVSVPNGRDAIVFAQSWLTTDAAALGAPERFVAGTYVAEGVGGSTARIAGVERGVLHLRAMRRGRMAFSLDAVGGSDRAPNIGAIAGTFAVDGRNATFADRARDCALALAGYAGRIVLTQHGTCGFGYAVNASGPYRRRARS